MAVGWLSPPLSGWLPQLPLPHQCRGVRGHSGQRWDRPWGACPWNRQHGAPQHGMMGCPAPQTLPGHPKPHRQSPRPRRFPGGLWPVLWFQRSLTGLGKGLWHYGLPGRAGMKGLGHGAGSGPLTAQHWAVTAATGGAGRASVGVCRGGPRACGGMPAGGWAGGCWGSAGTMRSACWVGALTPFPQELVCLRGDAQRELRGGGRRRELCEGGLPTLRLGAAPVPPRPGVSGDGAGGAGEAPQSRAESGRGPATVAAAADVYPPRVRVYFFARAGRPRAVPGG